MSPPRAVDIGGQTHPAYAAIAEAFAENFARRGELGAACCIYRDGTKVVDLWGGVRDAATGAPWQADTMVLVYSLTKGMAAMVLALAHARGWLDYDARVADYWPGFAQNGKAAITVRQLLAHQAGLHAFHRRVDRATIADRARLVAVLESERPRWPPGRRHAYHFLSLGFYAGELLRRVDPAGRSLGQVFRDEIAQPLGIEFHIGLPATVPDDRLAVLVQPGLVGSIAALPRGMRLALLNPWSETFRACMVNPGARVVHDPARIYARDLEVPSGGGVGTARAVAAAYGAFAAGGSALGLGPATLAELCAPARPPAEGLFDHVLRTEAAYALGFMKPFPGYDFGSPAAFGAPGAGGAFGYADPATRIGYGYVTNRIGTGIDADPRDLALRAALARVAAQVPGEPS